MKVTAVRWQREGEEVEKEERQMVTGSSDREMIWKRSVVL